MIFRRCRTGSGASDLHGSHITMSPSRESKGSLIDAVDNFFFAPASPLPLAVLRIGVSLVLVLQAFYVAPNFWDLFGGMGYIQRGALPEMGLSFITIPHYVRWMGAIGIGDSAAIIGLVAVYLVSLSALLLGWHTRL